MPRTFAVVCEAAADFRTAAGLAERVIRERVEWVDEDLLAGCPLWAELEPGVPYLLWRDAKNLAREAGIPSHGHFGDRPAEPDAHAARRALRLLKWRRDRSGRPLDGVLFIRDDDGDPSRRVGLEQAREDEQDLRGRVVIGLARCMREAWVLAGFDPGDAGEEARLAEARGGLGFDPCRKAHQLTAKHETDRRSAKRILNGLTGGDLDREAACWDRAPLTSLRDRGAENGLADFLTEVEERLVPLIAGDGPPPATAPGRR